MVSFRIPQSIPSFKADGANPGMVLEISKGCIMQITFIRQPFMIEMSEDHRDKCHLNDKGSNDEEISNKQLVKDRVDCKC